MTWFVATIGCTRGAATLSMPLERARTGGERLAVRVRVSRARSLRSRTARAAASLNAPLIPRWIAVHPLGLSRGR